MKAILIGISLALLSACNPIAELTRSFKSEAYQIGFETGVEFKAVFEASNSFNELVSSLDQWGGGEVSLDSYKDGDISDSELREGCEGWFEFGGAFSSLQGADIQNTPEDRADFTQGCVDGWNS